MGSQYISIQVTGKWNENMNSGKKLQLLGKHTINDT